MAVWKITFRKKTYCHGPEGGPSKNDLFIFFSGESVFLHLAEMIPQLKSRAAKSGQENVPETGAKKKPKKK